MNVRVAWLSLASVLFVSLAFADDHDPAARAAEETALRARIDSMDVDLQGLQNKLHKLEKEHPEDDAGRTSLHDQIKHLDHEEERLENRLRELVRLDPPEQHNVRASTPPIDEPLPVASPARPAPAPAQPPAPAAPPVSPAEPAQQAPPPASPPQSPPSDQHSASLHNAVDPAPYERAASTRVGMFYYNPYRWVAVGTSQLAVYNTYNEAYLLDFSGDCPSLATTDRIKIENFSTKVVAGRDGVIADGVRCPIAMIRELRVNRLPN